MAKVVYSPIVDRVAGRFGSVLFRRNGSVDYISRLPTAKRIPSAVLQQAAAYMWQAHWIWTNTRYRELGDPPSPFTTDPLYPQVWGGVSDLAAGRTPRSLYVGSYIKSLFLDVGSNDKADVFPFETTLPAPTVVYSVAEPERISVFVTTPPATGYSIIGSVGVLIFGYSQNVVPTPRIDIRDLEYLIDADDATNGLSGLRFIPTGGGYYQIVISSIYALAGVPQTLKTLRYSLPNRAYKTIPGPA